MGALARRHADFKGLPRKYHEFQQDVSGWWWELSNFKTQDFLMLHTKGKG